MAESMVPESHRLRVLIVEDTPERQEVLRGLFRDHAWITVHTAARAICLVEAYDFDLIALDYDLAGPGKGDEVASVIPGSRNAGATVIVHAMNSKGAERIVALLPKAKLLPLSRITRNNRTFKRLRSELAEGRYAGIFRDLGD
jgi:CheY-like chemotaxis protein